MTMYQLLSTFIFTGWMMSVAWGCTGIISPLVSAMCIKYGSRSICVLGGFVSALGALFSSFSERLLHVLIAWSVIASLGIGMSLVSRLYNEINLKTQIPELKVHSHFLEQNLVLLFKTRQLPPLTLRGNANHASVPILLAGRGDQFSLDPTPLIGPWAVDPYPQIVDPSGLLTSRLLTPGLLIPHPNIVDSCLPPPLFPEQNDRHL